MREISLAGAIGMPSRRSVPTILTCIDAIQSTKQEARKQGLDDLEQVLNQNRNNGRV